MQVSFARDLIFRTMNKFFHTKEAITSGEIGKQSFGYTGFIFSPMNTYVKY